MKRLVTLLLLVPTLAFAQVQVGQITSGSATTVGDTLQFNFAGDGFSGAGTFFFFPALFPPFSGQINIFEQSPELSMGVTLNGVPWSDADTNAAPGFANAIIGTNSDVPLHPGTYSVPFGFSADFFGAPASEFMGPGFPGCNIVQCQSLEFNGSGIATLELAPYSSPAGSVQLVQATFTFTAPEPSTLWLLLLGVVGLAVLGRPYRMQGTPGLQ